MNRHLNIVLIALLVLLAACNVAKKPDISNGNGSTGGGNGTSFSYSTNVLNLTANVTAVSIQPNLANPTTYFYSSYPTLPAGLTLSTTTGFITGTAVTPTVSSQYTISAYNGVETITSTLTITVNMQAPNFVTYPNLVFTKNVLQSFTPTVTGGAASAFTINPALPPGLSFNTSNGAISGTPLNPSITTHTVVAANAGGSKSVIITLTVNDLAPGTLNYTALLAPVVLVRNVTLVTPYIPDAELVATTVSYSISPSLPAGLSFNANTGVIFGTPTLASAPQLYTVTKFNSQGNSTFTFNLRVTNAPIALNYTSPMFLYRYIYNNPQGPTPTGGTPTTYSIIAGALPPGVSLSPTTGAIYGTPNTVSSVFSVTIRGQNSDGFVNQVVNITVQDTAPGSLSYVYTGDLYKNEPVSFSPTFVGSPPTSYVAPSLPPGLAINPTTGVISGTYNGTPPLAPSNVQSFAVTASNVAGSTATVLIFTLKERPPLSLGYLTAPPNYNGEFPLIAGSGTNLPIAPTITGGAPSNYLITPPLPAGLSFSTTTGIINGIPTQATVPTQHMIIAYNTGGTVVETITIEVKPGASGTLDYTALADSPTNNPFVWNSPIANLLPTITGGTGTYTYSTSPDISLLTGLSFNPATGIISGTPSKILTQTTFHFYATNGSSTATVDFEMQITNPPVTAMDYPDLSASPAVNTVTTGTTVSWSPSLTGGVIYSPPANYTTGRFAIYNAACTVLETNLTGKTGLTFDSLTGTISGVANVITHEFNNAGNANSAVTDMSFCIRSLQNGSTYVAANDEQYIFNLRIVPAAPILGVIPSPYDAVLTCSGGIPQTFTITPVNSGGALPTSNGCNAAQVIQPGAPLAGYTISPDASGLDTIGINNNTCALSGDFDTTTSLTAAGLTGFPLTKNMTITAVNSGGKFTTSFDINLKTAPTPSYAIDSTVANTQILSNFVTAAGFGIVPDDPNNGFANTCSADLDNTSDMTFDVNIDLPAVMSLDSSTGEITMPTGGIVPRTYVRMDAQDTLQATTGYQEFYMQGNASIPLFGDMVALAQIEYDINNDGNPDTAIAYHCANPGVTCSNSYLTSYLGVQGTDVPYYVLTSVVSEFPWRSANLDDDVACDAPYTSCSGNSTIPTLDETVSSSNPYRNDYPIRGIYSVAKSNTNNRLAIAFTDTLSRPYLAIIDLTRTSQIFTNIMALSAAVTQVRYVNNIVYVAQGSSIRAYAPTASAGLDDIKSFTQLSIWNSASQYNAAGIITDFDLIHANTDSFIDLIYSYNTNMQLVLGNGATPTFVSGGPGVSATVNLGTGTVVSFKLNDLDNDSSGSTMGLLNDLDIVALKSNGNMYIIRNDRNSFSGASVALHNSVANSEDVSGAVTFSKNRITIGDFDGDGLKEIATLVLSNVGANAFIRRYEQASASSITFSTSVANNVQIETTTAGASDNFVLGEARVRSLGTVRFPNGDYGLLHCTNTNNTGNARIRSGTTSNSSSCGVILHPDL